VDADGEREGLGRRRRRGVVRGAEDASGKSETASEGTVVLRLNEEEGRLDAVLAWKLFIDMFRLAYVCWSCGGN
jgi:hypothetical protein